MKEVLTSRRAVHVPRNARTEWDLTIMAILWCIWNERNRRIFLQKSRNSLALLLSVNSFTFLWFRNISKKKRIKFTHGSSPRVAGLMALQVADSD